MTAGSRLLISAGIALVILGLIWQFAGRHLHLGRLPGDIVVERPGFHLYFPVVTCLLISVAVSLVLLVIRMLGR